MDLKRKLKIKLKKPLSNNVLSMQERHRISVSWDINSTNHESCYQYTFKGEFLTYFDYIEFNNELQRHINNQ